MFGMLFPGQQQHSAGATTGGGQHPAGVLTPA